LGKPITALKNHLFQFLITVAIFATASALAETSSPSPSAATHLKYTCVMHPEVVQDKPGKCPKCGMKLVPMKSSTKAGIKRNQPERACKQGLYESAHGGHDMVAHEAHRLGATRGHDRAEMSMEQMAMPSSIDLADPMSRESSGTSWVPDSTPMYGRMFMFGNDMLMVHGGIFPRYTNVSTRRGDDRIDGPNWAMAMYSHPLGENAQLGSRAMMSLDPLTEGGRGYPLLLQTGETWRDQRCTIVSIRMICSTNCR
jgi:Heavy metal binding domain